MIGDKEKAFELPETISESIYQYLKKAIISGELKPNQMRNYETLRLKKEVIARPEKQKFSWNQILLEVNHGI